MILSLASSVNKRRPASFEEKESDAVTYSTGKGVLRDMVQAGSLTSKGHEEMLLEIEQLGEVLAAMQARGVDALMEQWEMDAWMAQVLSYDPFMPSLIFNEGEE